MLEDLLILWSSCRALGAAALKGSPIDALIRSCLLEERSADASFSQDTYALKWTFHNDLGLVFVAVYQRILHLLYVHDLLAAVRKEFSQIYDPKRTSYDDFGDIFRQLHLEAEARAEGMNKSKQAIASRPSPTVSHKTGPKVRGDSRGNAGGKKGGSGKHDSDGDSGKEHHAMANGTFKGQENGLKENSHAPAVVVKGKENGGAFNVNISYRSYGTRLRRNMVLLTMKPRSRLNLRQTRKGKYPGCGMTHLPTRSWISQTQPMREGTR